MGTHHQIIALRRKTKQNRNRNKNKKKKQNKNKNKNKAKQKKKNNKFQFESCNSHSAPRVTIFSMHFSIVYIEKLRYKGGR